MAITPRSPGPCLGMKSERFAWIIPLLIAGLETLSKLPRANEAKPLQFLYVSGANVERDQTKKPWVMGDYLLMRVSNQYSTPEP